MSIQIAQLTGSSIEADLKVSEATINEWLARGSTSSSHLSVELRAANSVVVRHGVFHARAQLPAAIEPGDSPRLTLVLASIVLAVALRAVVRQPFIHIHGRHVTIDLVSVSGLESWRELWKHVRGLTFVTAPGVLRVGLVAAVKDGESSAQLSSQLEREGTSMREWFEAQMAAGFPALAGSTIAGTLALKQELLNELLTKWLAAQKVDATAPRPDLSQSLRALQSATIRAEPGTLLVDFKIAL